MAVLLTASPWLSNVESRALIGPQPDFRFPPGRMETDKSSLAQWRESHRVAPEAERAQFDAMMLYASGRGRKPTDEDMQEAKRLRDIPHSN